MHRFLSETWLREYQRRWNRDPAQRGLLSSMHGTWAYAVDDPSGTVGLLRLQAGEAVEVRCSINGPVDLVLRASPADWRTLVTGRVTVRTALTSGMLRLQGSFVLALRYANALDQALALMVGIPTQWTPPTKETR